MPAEAAPADVQRSPARCRVAHAWMTEDDYLEIEILAAERGEHPDRLAAQILHGVLTRSSNPGKLVQALLD